MKYSHTITIDLPLEKVIELFDSKENMYKWQKGLQSVEHIRGDEGKVGAKSKLFYKMGKREMEMIETITKMNLPDMMESTYDANGVHNIQQNYFRDAGDGKTEWQSDSEFQFSGFMKFIYPLMKGAFKKQSLSFMKDFKEFAENESLESRT
ncbi:MAG: hypothetical protein CMP59_01325 [Flavobacteriales bacterium]|nr:hypothetical protein [Flavobacteriales bacterium]|tara:strand:- start:568 stop:1020 length:453 start_codon:yes stop_codon:yes gene_type:complete